MRHRKARGKKPAAVTLSEDELVTACCDYVRKQGYEIGNLVFLKIVKSRKDRIGRQLRGKVEFLAEVE